MPSVEVLHTYYADLRPAGSKHVFQGGNVMPPNMDTEPEVELRCPDTKAAKLKAAICRVRPVDQFGRDTLLFHGTCDPNSVPFPNANDHDNLRWYAFEPTMSLDFIKEEAHIRMKKNLPVGTPRLYVYRLKKPIRNLMLFADLEKWDRMGGQENLFEKSVCGINVDKKTPEGQELIKRAGELGCPLPEYAMAIRAQRFKIIRGLRGESCNGWVRLNGIGLLGKKMFVKSGFELALTHSDHENLIELVDTFDVADSPERYGSIGDDTTSMNELDWHLTNLPPTPPPVDRKRIPQTGPSTPPPQSSHRRVVNTQPRVKK